MTRGARSASANASRPHCTRSALLMTARRPSAIAWRRALRASARLCLARHAQASTGPARPRSSTHDFADASPPVTAGASKSRPLRSRPLPLTRTRGYEAPQSTDSVAPRVSASASSRGRKRDARDLDASDVAGGAASEGLFCRATRRRAGCERSERHPQEGVCGRGARDRVPPPAHSKDTS